MTAPYAHDSSMGAANKKMPNSHTLCLMTFPTWLEFLELPVLCPAGFMGQDPKSVASALSQSLAALPGNRTPGPKPCMAQPLLDEWCPDDHGV
jgi:hypothetical protein